MTRLTHGAAARSVRGGPTPEYAAWCQMRQRCNGPGTTGYQHWGGRGIRVCERWSVFENFLADMGPRPSPAHSLDRYPDPNGDYETGNCRWATRTEQARNTTANRLLTFNGETLSVAEWAERLHLNPNTIRNRLARGKTTEQALAAPAYLKRSV